MFLKIKPLNDNVKMMYSSHGTFNQGDSGLDLFCPETITINPGETICIDLQINCEAFGGLMGDNTNNISYYMYPRSSLSKTNFRLANSTGIIDAGYRGHLMGKFDEITTFEKNEQNTTNLGDPQRLVQICAPGLVPIYVEIVDNISKLGEETTRGSGGFGSTGL